MNKILELREKRVKAWEAAKAFLDSKRGADDLISAEDGAVYDKMEAEVINIGREIERLERAREIETELTTATTLPITNMPGVSASQSGRASAEYKAAFWNAIRSKNINSLEIVNSLKIGTDSEGGYLVPDEYDRTLVEALEEQNMFRQLASIIQTESGERQIPVVASKGTASWVDEEALIPESDNTFGQITLSAHKVATMIRISNELLNDNVFNLESYIANEFGRRIGAKEEEAFFVGDGSKKPTGILAETGGAPVGKTAASATALTLDEVLDLFYALKTPYRAKASFITNDTTMKAIRKLKDSNGQYLWQPSAKEGTPDMIFGKAIHTSAYVPAMAAGAKALVFGDYSYYWIADRKSRTFQRLNELFATTGQVGFLASQRVDGKLILAEAVQVLKMAGA